MSNNVIPVPTRTERESEKAQREKAAEEKKTFQTASAKHSVPAVPQCAGPGPWHAVPNDLDAELAETVEVDGLAFGGANQLKRRQAPRPAEIIDLVVTHIHCADHIPPFQIRSATGQHRRHGGVSGGGKGRGQGL